jgi:hypothetical protein
MQHRRKAPAVSDHAALGNQQKTALGGEWLCTKPITQLTTGGTDSHSHCDMQPASLRLAFTCHQHLTLTPAQCAINTHRQSRKCAGPHIATVAALQTCHSMECARRVLPALEMITHGWYCRVLAYQHCASSKWVQCKWQRQAPGFRSSSDLIGCISAWVRQCCSIVPEHLPHNGQCTQQPCTAADSCRL